KKTTSKLKCYATAAEHKTAVDQGCLTKAESKFGEAWARATAKGGCGGKIVGPLGPKTPRGRGDGRGRGLGAKGAPRARGERRRGGGMPAIRVLLRDRRRLLRRGGTLPLSQLHDDLSHEHLDHLDDVHHASLSRAALVRHGLDLHPVARPRLRDRV